MATYVVVTEDLKVYGLLYVRIVVNLQTTG